MSFFTKLKNTSVKDSDRTGKPLQSPIVVLTTNGSGTRVINARLDGSIRVWRVSTSGLADPIIIDNAHSGAVKSISWLPTLDTTFASAGGDSVVKIWRGSGSLERDISVGNSGNSGDAVTCNLVSFSPDGTVMVAAANGVIYAYSVLDNYSLVTQFDVAEHGKSTGVDLVTDITWTNRGSRCFFVGLSSGPVLIISYEHRRISIIHSLLGCRSVTCLLMDPKGKYFAAGSKEGVVSFWRTADMVNCRALTSIDQEISSISANKDGTFLCVGYKSGSNSRVFEIDTFKEVYEIPGTVAGEDSKSVVGWYSSKNYFVYSQDKSRVLGYVKEGSDDIGSDRTRGENGRDDKRKEENGRDDRRRDDRDRDDRERDRRRDDKRRDDRRRDDRRREDRRREDDRRKRR